MTCPALSCTGTVWVLLLWPPPPQQIVVYLCLWRISFYLQMYSPHQEFAQHERQVLLQYPSQTAPPPPMSPVITVPWILYGHIRLRRNKKKKISCINKTSVGVISTCAVRRATSSFQTCACWPAVVGHSERCYQTLYHWFLSSLFPFVHLYSFDTRGILRRGVPCSPYVIYFASLRFLRLRKEAQNLVKNLRSRTSD